MSGRRGGRRLRVGVMGLGPIGREVCRVVAGRPWAELAAGLDIDPDLAGRDLGEVAELPEALGVAVAPSTEAELDAVVHATVSDLRRAVLQVSPFLRRGVTVVSTCEELAFPLEAEVAEELDGAARAGGATLLGTGINPGFLLDALPATLTVACQEVSRIEAVRVVDAALRRRPLQEKVGAGLERSVWERRRDAGEIRHVGLPESARLLARAVGWEDVRVGPETIEPVVAEEEVETEFLRVARGRVAGVRQVVSGTRDGREVLRLELAMYVGARDPRDAVAVAGVPSFEMEIPGGVHGDRATAAVVANMLPRTVAAPPGLVTMAELPLGASL